MGHKSCWRGSVVYFQLYIIFAEFDTNALYDMYNISFKRLERYIIHISLFKTNTHKCLYKYYMCIQNESVQKCNRSIVVPARDLILVIRYLPAQKLALPAQKHSTIGKYEKKFNRKQTRESISHSIHVRNRVQRESKTRVSARAFTHTYIYNII